MKYFTLVIIYLTGMSIQGYGQKGPINIIRYLDDFSYLLESDTLERTELEKLKYIYPFKNKNINISFGGELREQYQYYKNPNFGDLKPGTVEDVNGYLWHRAMAHADLMLGEDWRVFTQFSSTFALGKENITTGIDQNALSLHQFFIKWSPQKSKGIFTQIGRQEFALGSNLTISMREGPNTRLTFDAVVRWSRKKVSSVLCVGGYACTSKKWCLR